jgi:hypothetical protein
LMALANCKSSNLALPEHDTEFQAVNRIYTAYENRAKLHYPN